VEKALAPLGRAAGFIGAGVELAALAAGTNPQ
jgi:hypothetical protein